MPTLRPVISSMYHQNVKIKAHKTLADLQGPINIPLLGNFLLYLKKENRGCLHKALVR